MLRHFLTNQYKNFRRRKQNENVSSTRFGQFPKKAETTKTKLAVRLSAELTQRRELWNACYAFSIQG